MTDENLSVLPLNVSKEIGDALLDGARQDCFFRQEVTLPLLQLGEAQLHEQGHRTPVKGVHRDSPL